MYVGRNHVMTKKKIQQGKERRADKPIQTEVKARSVQKLPQSFLILSYFRILEKYSLMQGPAYNVGPWFDVDIDLVFTLMKPYYSVGDTASVLHTLCQCVCVCVWLLHHRLKCKQHYAFQVHQSQTTLI